MKEVNYKGSRSLLQLPLFMMDRVEWANDLLPGKGGSNEASNVGESTFDEEGTPVEDSSFSLISPIFVLFGSICAMVHYLCEYFCISD